MLSVTLSECPDVPRNLHESFARQNGAILSGPGVGPDRCIAVAVIPTYFAYWGGCPYFDDYYLDDYGYDYGGTCYYSRRLRARVCSEY
ncbi:hypothetical protein HYPDE_33978 [Hyphomicrobium denitrificans 1NES1]|uniref:Uncharacterized protein n=1 Tax=Hyphomicrobium denitrificans 1NES1 TaxID=670307 RepID=N0B633_9HYPH|nr:hypothetical protein HYPDE_33978 [Hyphomicrobium denitrificans 1NES1]